jgi:cAMP phosphodiesterase
MDDNTTAFLLRSVASDWRKGSILALDAGIHLSAVANILERDFPRNGQDTSSSVPATITSGPFKGLSCPFRSCTANAAYFIRHLVDTFVISHPHLDHMAGFVVNTAMPPGLRPKRLAALPTTVEAFKRHIFNNVIWPNLTDENNGAGLVSYLRLVEGGSPALGKGEDKGYIEIADGLCIKTFSVSHGHCMERHEHRGSSVGLHSIGSATLNSHRGLSMSPTSGNLGTMSPTYGKPEPEHTCVYDSSAHFVRDILTGKEVLVFGDVEPDSLSLSPRNFEVWQEAAPKVISGSLKAIFIECSYDDSQPDETLFGHMAPRHLITELKNFARCVVDENTGSSERQSRKRKRFSNGIMGATRGKATRSLPTLRTRSSSGVSPRSQPQQSIESADEVSGDEDDPLFAIPSIGSPESMRKTPTSAPTTHAYTLAGLKVIIIHMKDRLDDSGPAGPHILSQLKKYEEEVKLGCEFIISEPGLSLYF